MRTPMLPSDHCFTFTTATGSCYRVDTSAMTLERLTGSGPPTERVGQGAHRFEQAGPFQVGRACIIFWGKHTEHKAVAGATPTTITSRIVSIEGRRND